VLWLADKYLPPLIMESWVASLISILSSSFPVVGSTQVH
jgi:hypothetical protein